LLPSPSPNSKSHRADSRAVASADIATAEANESEPRAPVTQESHIDATTEPLAPACQAAAAAQAAKEEMLWDDDDSEERPKKARKGRPKKVKEVQTAATDEPGSSKRASKRRVAETSAAHAKQTKRMKLQKGSESTVEVCTISAQRAGENLGEAVPDLVQAVAPLNGTKRKRLTKKTQRSEWEGCVKEEGRSSTSSAGVREEDDHGMASTVRGTSVKLEVRSSKGMSTAVKTEDQQMHSSSIVASVGSSSKPINATTIGGSSASRAPRVVKRIGTTCRTPKQEEMSPSSLAQSGAESSSGSPQCAGGVVCFTSTGLELGTKHRRQLRSRLGVKFVDEWTPEVTHLLADTFRRTTKMMCAICSGAIVVTPDYIDACLRSGSLVDDAPYVLKDAVCEAAFAKKHGLPRYSLQVALEESRRSGPLLAGVAVHCSPVVMGRSEMKILVEAAGATWLRHVPDTSEAAEAQPVLLLGKAGTEPPPRHAERWRLHTAYDAELLREAACTQKLRYDVYRL